MSVDNISQFLDALAPRVEVEEEAWSDVLARAESLAGSQVGDRRVVALAQTLGRTGIHAHQRVRARRRRVLLLVALVVLAFAVVVGTVYALGYHLISFAGAPSAPGPVVTEFSAFTKGAPPGMDPQAIVSDTRFLGEVAGNRLWVAPTKAGGFCWVWSQSTGGCQAAGSTPLDVSWGPAAVDGVVGIRWVDAVELRLDNGATIYPEVIWVSAPIRAGFFHYKAPAGRTITTVLALKGGEVVAREGGR